MTATSLQYHSKTMDILVGQYTIEEYLDIERRTGERHEFYDGQVIRMSGGSISHNRVSRNIVQHLGNALDEKNDFELFGSDQKIYLPKLNAYLYPDAIVVAHTPILTDKIAEAITNPILVIEVLSPSTENYDRRDKFMKYRTLESFQEYVIVQQDSAEVLSFFRSGPHTWEEQEFNGLDHTVYFKSIDIHLPLALIYKKVAL
jgi:Uma2 family endonuclease